MNVWKAFADITHLVFELYYELNYESGGGGGVSSCNWHTLGVGQLKVKRQSD